MLYGEDADELVVLFDDARHGVGFFDFVNTPDRSYAAIKIEVLSGAVIGVLVYPLAALAVQHHPAWRPALVPCPLPETAERIVRDIKKLYDRYGLIPDSDAAG